MSFFDKIPSRLSLGLMLFGTSFFLFVLRSNLSINLVAMVQSSEVDDNGTQIVQPDYGPRYNWTAYEQSTLLGAYFYGYAITSIPLGILVDKYGLAKSTIGWGFALSVLMTVAAPFAVGSFAMMVALRVGIGLASAGQIPAFYRLVARWVPPNEKGRFMTALFGTEIGTVLTWSLCGLLIEQFGWPAAFYGPGLVAAVFTVVWYFVVFDAPDQHPRILPKEREFIMQSMEGLDNDLKAWPPFGRMMISMPFLSLLLLHYGNIWGSYFLLTAAPKFMSDVLHFNLTSAGVFASLPYLVRLFTGPMFGALGDLIKARQWMSTVMVRKVFTISSHVIPGLFVLAVPYVSYNPYACVAFMTISYGFNGAVSLTSFANAYDLSPNFAGSVFSVMNAVATTAGILSPLVVAFFTAERNTIDEWYQIFAVGAGIYIVPSVVYAIFGSGDIQPWNYAKVVVDIKDKEEFENSNDVVVKHNA